MGRSSSATSTACSMPMLAGGGEHTLRVGVPEEHPFLKKQTRLTFARCGIVDPRSLDDYKAHDGYKGLAKALGQSRAASSRRSRNPACAAAAAPDSRPASSGRRSPRPRPTEIHRLQCRRRRQRHLRRPHDHGRRSVRADRRHDDRRHRRRRDQGLHLYPLGISARHRGDERRDRRRAARRHARQERRRFGLRLRSRSARRRRRLCLRRGNLAARKPRRQARPGARQAAAAGA